MQNKRAMSHGVQDRRGKAFQVLRLLGLAALALVSTRHPSFAFAGSIDTLVGTLVTRDGAKSECKDFFPCQIAVLNNQILVADQFVSIDDSVMENGKAKLVFLNYTAGGSASPEMTTLVDLSTGRVITIVLDGYYRKTDTNSKMASFSRGITWGEVPWGETDEYGDYVRKMYRYDFGSNAIKTIRTVPIYYFKPLTAEMSSEEFLSSPALRTSLLNMMTQAEFLKFHSFFGVSGNIKIVDGKYIVGGGCIPHSCGSNEGMFVIDRASGNAWAIYYERKWIQAQNTSTERGEFIGPDLANYPGIKAIFKNWLSDHKSFDTDKILIVRGKAVAEFSNPLNHPTRTKIQLVHDSGVYSVPVILNGSLALNFVVDSGAADVTISEDIFQMLMATGSIQSKDFQPMQSYTLADGSHIKSKVFMMHEMKVGDRIIPNVTASVSGLEGSLLLGQSFLSRFKSVSFDYSHGTLVLE
jgi:hypothetical protein